MARWWARHAVVFWLCSINTAAAVCINCINTSILANGASLAHFVTLTFWFKHYSCSLLILSLFGLSLYDVQQAWTYHNKRVVLPKTGKKIVILYPYWLPITATSAQRSLSSGLGPGRCGEVRLCTNILNEKGTNWIRYQFWRYSEFKPVLSRHSRGVLYCPPNTGFDR